MPSSSKVSTLPRDTCSANARIVSDRGKLRELIQVCSRAVNQAFEKEQPDELVGALTASLEQLARRSQGDDYDPAASWRDVVSSWDRGTVATGLKDLDRVTGGMTRGDIVVVAGRTSHGKTGLSIDRAKAMAKAGARVEYLTLEERVEALTRRLVANEAGISLYRLRGGQCSPREFQLAEAAVETLQKLPLQVRGLETIRSTDERAVLGAVSLARADVVMLDHLGKVEPRKQRGEEYTYALRRVMNRLHTIGIRDGKVLWVCAQLSRDIDKRKGAPTLSDIADSKSVEDSARQVILLYWPSKHDPKVHAEEYLAIVAKNNEGGTGPATLRYQAWCGRFLDAEDAE